MGLTRSPLLATGQHDLAKLTGGVLEQDVNPAGHRVQREARLHVEHLQRRRERREVGHGAHLRAALDDELSQGRAARERPGQLAQLQAARDVELLRAGTQHYARSARRVPHGGRHGLLRCMQRSHLQRWEARLRLGRLGQEGDVEAAREIEAHELAQASRASALGSVPIERPSGGLQLTAGFEWP